MSRTLRRIRHWTNLKFHYFYGAVKAIPSILQGIDAVTKNIKDQLINLEADSALIKARMTENESMALFASVGMALTTWAKMEEVLVLIMSLLMRTSSKRAGLIMFSIINFSTWLTIIHDLFEMDDHLSVHQKQWNKISESIRAIKDQRDQLAHQSVDTRVADEVAAIKASRLDARRKQQRQIPMTSVEVLEFTKDVLAITGRLEALAEKMVETLEAHYGKSD